MSRHIWYSSATDITGQNLADALNANGGKRKPRNLTSDDIVIGWGTKTDEAADMGRAKVLNHPDQIRANRNKYVTLQTLLGDRNVRSGIAAFCTAQDVVQSLDARRATMKLPLIGRTNYHQGGKGLWICLTKDQVSRAIDDGAQYFQNYMDIKNEYRLHVAFGNIIYAQKKIENASEASWIAQRKEKIENYAQKNNVDLNDVTVDYVLSRLVKEAVLPDRIVRSNKKGWKFSGVALGNIASSLKDLAVASVTAVGLDFGAVDCAIGTDENPYIIEINSGPGLQGTSLEKYTEAFGAKLTEMERPPRVERPRRAAAAQPRVNRAAAGGRAVGADIADENAGGLVRVMRNVRTDEQAQALLDALVRGDI
jgi:glutathione synthase/RimK-type ligase-like ATP-grasp enzyme